jgi:RNA polymerase sigma factor (TIGR02999 family)
MRSEADFLRLARYLMAQILIEYARSRRVLKRRHTQLPLDEASSVPENSADSHYDVLAALDALEERDPELRRLVDLRYFCGYSIAETAQLLQVGQTKVKSDWRLARLWLQRELGIGESLSTDDDS